MLRWREGGWVFVLVDPPAATVAEIDALSWGGHGHGHFLVPDDRVIGVVDGGQARAYPLSILNWHEVANDTLGGLRVGFETGTAPTVFVTTPTRTARVWYSSWFAWYALHSEDPVLSAVGDP
jgi:hypothetical protein